MPFNNLISYIQWWTPNDWMMNLLEWTYTNIDIDTNLDKSVTEGCITIINYKSK